MTSTRRRAQRRGRNDTPEPIEILNDASEPVDNNPMDEPSRRSTRRRTRGSSSASTTKNHKAGAGAGTEGSEDDSNPEETTNTNTITTTITNNTIKTSARRSSRKRVPQEANADDDSDDEVPFIRRFSGKSSRLKKESTSAESSTDDRSSTAPAARKKIRKRTPEASATDDESQDEQSKKGRTRRRTPPPSTWTPRSDGHSSEDDSDDDVPLNQLAIRRAQKRDASEKSQSGDDDDSGSKKKRGRSKSSTSNDITNLDVVHRDDTKAPRIRKGRRWGPNDTSNSDDEPPKARQKKRGHHDSATDSADDTACDAVSASKGPKKKGNNKNSVVEISTKSLDRVTSKEKSQTRNQKRQRTSHSTPKQRKAKQPNDLSNDKETKTETEKESKDEEDVATSGDNQTSIPKDKTRKFFHQTNTNDTERNNADATKSTEGQQKMGKDLSSETKLKEKEDQKGRETADQASNALATLGDKYGGNPVVKHLSGVSIKEKRHKEVNAKAPVEKEAKSITTPLQKEDSKGKDTGMLLSDPLSFLAQIANSRIGQPKAPSHKKEEPTNQNHIVESKTERVSSTLEKDKDVVSASAQQHNSETDKETTATSLKAIDQLSTNHIATSTKTETVDENSLSLRANKTKAGVVALDSVQSEKANEETAVKDLTHSSAHSSYSRELTDERSSTEGTSESVRKSYSTNKAGTISLKINTQQISTADDKATTNLDAVNEEKKAPTKNETELLSPNHKNLDISSVQVQETSQKNDTQSESIRNEGKPISPEPPENEINTKEDKVTPLDRNALELPLNGVKVGVATIEPSEVCGKNNAIEDKVTDCEVIKSQQTTVSKNADEDKNAVTTVKAKKCEEVASTKLIAVDLDVADKTKITSEPGASNKHAVEDEKSNEKSEQSQPQLLTSPIYFTAKSSHDGVRDPDTKSQDSEISKDPAQTIEVPNQEDSRESRQKLQKTVDALLSTGKPNFQEVTQIESDVQTKVSEADSKPYITSVDDTYKTPNDNILSAKTIETEASVGNSVNDEAEIAFVKSQRKLATTEDVKQTETSAADANNEEVGASLPVDENAGETSKFGISSEENILSHVLKDPDSEATTGKDIDLTADKSVDIESRGNQAPGKEIDRSVHIETTPESTKEESGQPHTAWEFNREDTEKIPSTALDVKGNVGRKEHNLSQHKNVGAIETASILRGFDVSANKNHVLESNEEGGTRLDNDLHTHKNPEIPLKGVSTREVIDPVACKNLHIAVVKTSSEAKPNEGVLTERVETFAITESLVANDMNQHKEGVARQTSLLTEERTAILTPKPEQRQADQQNTQNNPAASTPGQEAAASPTVQNTLTQNKNVKEIAKKMQVTVQHYPQKAVDPNTKESKGVFQTKTPSNSANQRLDTKEKVNETHLIAAIPGIDTCKESRTEAPQKGTAPVRAEEHSIDGTQPTFHESKVVSMVDRENLKSENTPCIALEKTNDQKEEKGATSKKGHGAQSPRCTVVQEVVSILDATLGNSQSINSGHHMSGLAETNPARNDKRQNSASQSNTTGVLYAEEDDEAKGGITKVIQRGGNSTNPALQAAPVHQTIANDELEDTSQPSAAVTHPTSITKESTSPQDDHSLKVPKIVKSDAATDGLMADSKVKGWKSVIEFQAKDIVTEGAKINVTEARTQMLEPNSPACGNTAPHTISPKGEMGAKEKVLTGSNTLPSTIYNESKPSIHDKVANIKGVDTFNKMVQEKIIEKAENTKGESTTETRKQDAEVNAVVHDKGVNKGESLELNQSPKRRVSPNLPSFDFVFPSFGQKNTTLLRGDAEANKRPSALNKLVNIANIKVKLYARGLKAHKGRNPHHLFAEYWAAISKCMGAYNSVLLYQQLKRTREVIDEFLTTKKLRQLHNSMIIGLMSHCFHDSGRAKEIYSVAPPNLRRRIKHKAKQCSQTHITDRLLQDIEADFDRDAILWSSNVGSVPFKQEPVEAPIVQVRETPADNSNSRMPGALAIDPVVRKAAQDSGMKVAENAVWLTVIGLREYIKNTLKGTVAGIKSIESSQLASRTRNEDNAAKILTKPSNPNLSTPSTRTPKAALLGKPTNNERTHITALDLATYQMTTHVGQGRFTSRLGIERCRQALFTPIQTLAPQEFQSVRSYLASGIKVTAIENKKQRVNPKRNPNFAPPAATHGKSKPPTEPPISEQQQAMSSSQPRTSPVVQPAGGSASAKEKPGDESATQTEEQGRSANTNRSPVVGMGRGAKNLAALRQRAVAPQMPEESSTGEESGRDNSIVVPVERSQGKPGIAQLRQAGVKQNKTHANSMASSQTKPQSQQPLQRPKGKPGIAHLRQPLRKDGGVSIPEKVQVPQMQQVEQRPKGKPGVAKLMRTVTAAASSSVPPQTTGKSTTSKTGQEPLQSTQPLKTQGFDTTPKTIKAEPIDLTGSEDSGDERLRQNETKPADLPIEGKSKSDGNSEEKTPRNPPPRGRGRGFGVKNLSAMMGRNTTSGDDKSNDSSDPKGN